jgi:hypothetical protein
MKAHFLKVISISAVIGLAATFGARAACSDDDIKGDWTWEITAYLSATSIYTFVCPVTIRSNLAFKSAECTEIDNLAHSPKATLDIDGRFTVSKSCVVRNDRKIKLVYTKHDGTTVTWNMDGFDGWIARNNVAMTAVLSSGPAKVAKITAFHR